ncbi:MAG: DUF6261 family protein [Tannerella sp.]|jgi:hypothetical protein|nr:DUF6261 family protein [Tannerella sp.]
MRFLTLHKSQLHADEHNKFHQRFMELLDKYPVVIAFVAPQYKIMEDLLAIESKLIEAQRSSAYTELLAEIDIKQDTSISGIKKIIEVGLISFDPLVVEAAKRLSLRMRSFKNIQSKRYEGESASIGILISDFRSSFPGDIVTLGLVPWLNKLETEHNQYDEIFELRNTSLSERISVKLKDIRKQIDALYKDMTEHIAAAITNADTDIYLEFALQLDQEIIYYNAKSTHHARKDISDVNIDDIPTQTYTGDPVNYIPTVYYSEEGKKTIKLIFGKNFTVTYKNNVEVGTAKLVITGKGLYRGNKIVTFNIASEVI